MAQRKLTWDRCDCCGGYVPLIDGNNDNNAPWGRGGDCPGLASAAGNCGCFEGRDEELESWAEAL